MGLVIRWMRLCRGRPKTADTTRDNKTIKGSRAAVDVDALPVSDRIKT